jgi:hypothetical protein
MGVEQQAFDQIKMVISRKMLLAFLDFNEAGVSCLHSR